MTVGMKMFGVGSLVMKLVLKHNAAIRRISKNCNNKVLQS